MSEFEEETYSTIFAALKHPIRRKILRLLSEKPRSFTEMQNLFNVDSPYLTYHLDSLRELVSKTEDGRYRLSSIGESATLLMRGVEETPKTKVKKELLEDTRKLTVFLVPFLLLVFWWIQRSAINHKNFLGLTFYSFIFLGIGAFLLLFSRIERASTKMRSVLYAVTIASLIVNIMAANSIATVPRTGERIYHHTSYLGGTIVFDGDRDRDRWERTLFRINYSARDPHIFFPVGYISFWADVSLRGTFWVNLQFLPEHKGYDQIFRLFKGNVTIDGKQWINGGVKYHGLGEIDDWIFRHWHLFGHYEKGYSVFLLIGLRIDEWYSEPTYPLNVTFNLGPSLGPASAYIEVTDRQTLSNYQKGIAILLCGIFAAVYIQILGKPIIKTVKRSSE